MKVLIPTIMYGRHEVFEVFAEGVKQLQDSFLDIQIDCLVVGTGDREIVEKHGFEYHEFENMPLSRKAQERLRLSEGRADYYLFLGSDDFISVDTFKYCLDYMKSGHDFIAPYDILLFNKGKMYYAEGYNSYHPRNGGPLAVGRIVSNGLLNKCGWKLWSGNRAKNIDGLAYSRLSQFATNKHFYRLSDIQGVIVDVKTEDNLSEFNPERYEYLGLDVEYISKRMAEKTKPLRENINPTAIIHENVTIGKNVTIGAGCIIGSNGGIRGCQVFNGSIEIGDNVIIDSNVVIAKGKEGVTKIGNNVWIGNLANIGHNVTIGNDTEVGAGSFVCGHAEIGERVKIKTGVNIRNRVKVNNGITIGMGSNVLNDLTQLDTTYYGTPCENML